MLPNHFVCAFQPLALPIPLLHSIHFHHQGRHIHVGAYRVELSHVEIDGVAPIHIPPGSTGLTKLARPTKFMAKGTEMGPTWKTDSFKLDYMRLCESALSLCATLTVLPKLFA